MSIALERYYRRHRLSSWVSRIVSLVSGLLMGIGLMSLFKAQPVGLVFLVFGGIPLIANMMVMRQRHKHYMRLAAGPIADRYVMTDGLRRPVTTIEGFRTIRAMRTLSPATYFMAVQSVADARLYEFELTEPEFQYTLIGDRGNPVPYFFPMLADLFARTLRKARRNPVISTPIS